MTDQPILSILRYYWDAQTIFSAHSPFVYTFMKKVMNGKTTNDATKRIEAERSLLKKSSEEISFVDFGAGSIGGSNATKRTVRDIAENSLSGAWQCGVMHRMVKEYQVKNILELGTSLGVSTAYLACADSSARVITLEGNPASAEWAKRLWSKLLLANISTRIGEFASTLSGALDELESLDLVFLDGNHRKEATLEYFETIRSHIHAKSIVVVDDIYWSKGMHEAWRCLQQDPSVAFSIDVFRMGVLFFDPTIMPKQHFKLINYRYKPWSIGVFG